MNNSNRGYEKLKRLSRIKSVKMVNSIWADVQSEMTSINFERCFFLLLKKTTQKNVKIYFAELLLDYFDKMGFEYSESLINHFCSFSNNVKSRKKTKSFRSRLGIQGTGPGIATSARLSHGFGLSAPMRD